MTPARWSRLVAAGIVVACLFPEVPRYRAERGLYRATSALRIILAGGAPDRGAAVAWVEETAVSAARDLSGDSRPLVVAGSSRLVTRDAAGALTWYLRAFETEERAEIDLNIGRALMMQHDLAGAQRAFLRAGWLSPLVLDELPDVARAPLRAEIERLAGLLVGGRLSEAPPPPSRAASSPTSAVRE